MSAIETTPTVVHARGLWRTYGADETAVAALRGADISVFGGEVLAITGPSGSGKTTLLNCLAGLDSADEGTIDVLGTEVHGLDYEAAVEWRRQNLAILFQDPGLFPYLSARENVEISLRIRGIDRATRKRSTTDALERLGLGNHADHRPIELSGGQQQRVAIARALAAPPKLLIADEPTAQLDADTSLLVLDELRGAVETHDLTVIMTTHDPTAQAFADRSVRLVGGTVLDGGTASDEVTVSDQEAQ